MADVAKVQSGDIIRATLYNNLVDQANTAATKSETNRTDLAVMKVNVSSALQEVETLDGKVTALQTSVSQANTKADTAVNTANAANNNVGRSYMSAELVPIGNSFLLSFTDNNGDRTDIDLLPLIEFIRSGG